MGLREDSLKRLLFCISKRAVKVKREGARKLATSRKCGWRLKGGEWNVVTSFLSGTSLAHDSGACGHEPRLDILYISFSKKKRKHSQGEEGDTVFILALTLLEANCVLLSQFLKALEYFESLIYDGKRDFIRRGYQKMNFCNERILVCWTGTVRRIFPRYNFSLFSKWSTGKIDNRFE